MKRSFPEFQAELVARGGPLADDLRHDLFFVASRHDRRWMQAAHGVAVLLRQLLWMVLVTVRDRRPFPDGVVIAVATRDGASGVGTLDAFVARLGPDHAVVYVGPAGVRLSTSSVPVRPLGGLTIPGLLRALSRPTRMPGALPARVSPVLAWCEAVRFELLLEAWRQSVRSPPKMLLLHNDFDLFSRAALRAIGPRTDCSCIQHGVPTDEFFPAAAPVQVVWGPISERVFSARGPDGMRVIVDDLGRGGTARTPEGPPAGIAVVSQTHTGIYGIDLRSRFVEFVRDAAGSGLALTILLHPEEARRGHPYGEEPMLTVSRPPHALLRSASPPWLVVGYSSSALLDAAILGHYVVGLDWPVEASIEAWEHGAPPVRVRDAEGVAEQFAALARGGDRSRFAERQARWLGQVYQGIRFEPGSCEREHA